MKQIRRILSLLALFLLVSILPISAYAHPGRTDSDGGHYDSSTGEYHYHHGYSAHQHYDMDGDGIKDCPYNFVDKTTHSAGSGSSTSSSTTASNKKTVSSTVNAKQPAAEETIPISEFGDMARNALCVMAILVAVILVLIYCTLKKNAKINDCYKIIDQERKASKEELANQKDKLSQYYEDRIKEIQEQHDLLYKKYRHCEDESSKLSSELEESNNIINQLQTIQKFEDSVQLSDLGIPKDVYFSDDGIPVQGATSIIKPYGNFTVYVSERGKAYHSYSGCGGSYLTPVHIYEIVGEKVPCKRCVINPPERVPEWYSKVKLLREISRNTHKNIKPSPSHAPDAKGDVPP